MRSIIQKRGQVWVETVIYTLIGLAIIGIVLAGALPKINAKKDEIMIDQSINALSTIDNKIYEVQRAPGNKRVVSLDIKEGSLIVDMTRNRIYWDLTSSYPYSDVGYTVPINNMNVTTTEDGGEYNVVISTSYSVDIKYDGLNDGLKELTAAPTPYNLIIENLGKEDGKIIIQLSDN